MVKIEKDNFTVNSVNNYYKIDNLKAKEDGITVILTASIHGDEIKASVFAFDLLNIYSLKDEINDNIKTIIIYPFINKSGIRNKSRDAVWFGNNNNDCYENSDVDYRESIKYIIHEYTNDKLLLIDIHTSKNIIPSLIIDQTDSKCTKLEYMLDLFNGADNKIEPIRYHNDLETLKRYVNKNIENGYAYTYEFGTSELFSTDTFVDNIYDFINLASDEIYDGKFDKKIKNKIVVKTVPLNSPCSGIIEYAPVGVYNAGDDIAIVHDLYEYENIISVIKAPSTGCFVSCVTDYYIDIGEVFGYFNMYYEKVE